MGMHSAEEPATDPHGSPGPVGAPWPGLSAPHPAPRPAPYTAWYGEVVPPAVEPPPAGGLADRFAGTTWPQVGLLAVLGVLAVALVMVLTGQAASAGSLVSSALLIGGISVVVSTRIRRRNY